MDTAAPFIGIDFGTSYSKMAWYDPRTGRAEIIRNNEGQEEMPSVVYLGRSEGETLVGQLAERKLEEEKVEQQRFVLSIKRNLITAPTKVLDGNRVYRSVDVAAKILRKLKEDAEALHFQQTVPRAVITYPAAFDPLQQDKIKQAAMLAGFNEVVLVAEPVAAALAYGYTGLKVGNYILVYDFGGGTFDVAVLARNPDETFSMALAPRGLKECGGDDLDRELYDYCEEIALQNLKRSISLKGDVDLQFLRQCRKRKENLSRAQQETFSYALQSDTIPPVWFQYALNRATFEDRIRKYIDHTVLLTQEVMEEANTNHCKVDTVVLIGGSSRVPLVQRSLSSALPVQPQDWQQRDFAVVLGAAYYGQRTWKTIKTVMKPTAPVLSPGEQYQRIVSAIWSPATGLTRAQVDELAARANRLGLTEDEATAIERKVMGHSRASILERQHQTALGEYRTLVQKAWADKILTPVEVNDLAAQASRLGLDKNEVAAVEYSILGDIKEMILYKVPPPPPPPPLPYIPSLGAYVPPRAEWKFTPVKIIPLVLLVLLVLFALAAIAEGEVGAFVVFAIPAGLCLWWLLHKPKLKGTS